MWNMVYPINVFIVCLKNTVLSLLKFLVFNWLLYSIVVACLKTVFSEIIHYLDISDLHFIYEFNKYSTVWAAYHMN